MFVNAYAEEIFSLGREMVYELRAGPGGRPARLLVGIADVVPKLACHRLLKTVLEMEDTVKRKIKHPAVAAIAEAAKKYGLMA